MELTGLDYLTMPLPALKNHPNYSPHAYRIMQAISKMSTNEIEQLDIIGGKLRGTK